MNRDDIVNGAADLGVDLEGHIDFCVEAMKGIAGELGLDGPLRKRHDGTIRRPMIRSATGNGYGMLFTSVDRDAIPPYILERDAFEKHKVHGDTLAQAGLDRIPKRRAMLSSCSFGIALSITIPTPVLLPSSWVAI